MKKLYTYSILLMLSNSALSQTFEKINTGIVVNTPSDSRSVNWVDINNDGLLDLMITNGLNTGQNNFMYINKGNEVFESINSNDPIINDNSPSDGATWADIDNDGDLDCYVATWYNKKNLFYINNGNNSFTPIKTGTIATELTYSETASWADYDKDGNLDLYITNSEGNKRNILYKGNGDSTFTKIGTGTQSTDMFVSRSVNWVDIDNDKDLDLFVTNELNQKVNLYLNNTGSFDKVTTGTLVNTGGNIMSSSFGDYDNDGDMDLILAYFDATQNRLFNNQGDGTFVEITLPFNTRAYSFGTSWGDIDNDGDLDLYITNAFAPTAVKNLLYINNGNGSFSLDDTNTVVSVSGWSYGCAFGDYNNDGFLDLAVANCYNKTQVNSLFKNKGNQNNWFVLECVGTISNKSAIGARVRIKATINGQNIWQTREINTQSGHNGQNMMATHFGLGDATTIDSIEIQWPSGITDQYKNVSINQKLKAFENISLGKEHEKKSDLTVYPNPFTNKLTIQLNNSKENSSIEVKVLDMMGRLVFKEFFNSSKGQNSIELDLKKLNPGNYILSIIDDEGFVQKCKTLKL